MLVGIAAGVAGLLLISTTAPGSLATALATAGIVAVVLSLVPGTPGTLAALGAAVVAVVAVVVAPSGYGLLFAFLLVACALLARTAARSFPGVELVTAVMSSERLARESVLLDERAHAELTRARRYGRSLSVVTVTVEPHDRRTTRLAVDAGRAMTRELRITDVVGVTDDGEAVAVLPDTGTEVVSVLVGRLSESICASGATGGIGFATFPDDAVTWRELTAAARARQVPLSAPEPAPSPVIDVLTESQQLAG